MIAYRRGDLSVFLFGFAKSDRETIGDDEEADYRTLGGVWLGDETKIARDVTAGILIEVKP